MGTTKNQLQRCCVLIFALVLTPLLHAQDLEKSHNETIKTSQGFQLYQIISFPAVPDALRYEVEIEKLDGRETVPVEFIETTENKIRVSLRVGAYRYRITAYNKMNLLEGRSEWQNFQVIPAVEPSAESYQPFYGLFFELKDPEGVLVVTGKGFSRQTEFALVKIDPKYDWTGVTLEGRRDVLIPSSVEVAGGQARLKFNRSTLRNGNYAIFMRNPGGLWTCFGKVQVGNHSNAGMAFSFAWSPMIALFDYKNAVAWDGEQRLDLFNPQGYDFRLAWIFRYSMVGNFGLELQMFSLVDNARQREWADNGKGSIFEAIHGGTLNFLYQRPAAERWQHNIRIGMGAGEAYLYDDQVSFETEYYKYESAADIYLHLGYSAQFFLWKNLYLEAGLDLLYGVGFKTAANALILRPALGMGWQMGRWADYSEVAERAKRGEDHSVPVTEPPKAETVFSIRWLPLVPLYGFDQYATLDYPSYYEDGSYNNERRQFLQSFNPGGIGILIAVLPHRWGRNKLGFGFEFSLLDHKNRDLSETSGLDLINRALFGLYYQRVASEKWQIGVHAGIGLSNAYDYDVYETHSFYNSDSLSIRANGGGVSFATNFGVSGQYFFWNNAYIEAGLDLDLLSYYGTTRGSLRPIIALGWQGYRNNETGLRLPGPGLPLLRPKQ